MDTTNMTRSPVFIHALFRTGSTYFWNKFHQAGRYCCFYEPLHHFLLEIGRGTAARFVKSDVLFGDTTVDEKKYFYEYERLVRKGSDALPFFSKSFIFDDYCAAENVDLKRYIDSLLSATEGKRAVLQFNRSALRIGWFKRNYPEGLHLYLVRGYRDQWESHIRKERAGKKIFVVMDLMISGLNKDSSFFAPLNDHVPLVTFRDAVFENERKFYDTICPAYSDEEKYFIFFYIWLTAFIENVIGSDMIVDINQLVRDNDYRERIRSGLAKHGIEGVDFSDVAIPEYETFTLEPDMMSRIESEVKDIVFAALPQDKMTAFRSALSEEDRECFDLNPDQVFSLDGSGSGRIESAVRREKKHDEIIRRLFDELESVRSRHVQDHRRLMEQHDRLREQIVFTRQSIYDSSTYRAGHLLLTPLKVIRRFGNRLLKSTPPAPCEGSDSVENGGDSEDGRNTG